MHARRAPARAIAKLRSARAFGAALAVLCLVGPAAAQVASLRVYGTADGLRSLGADCLVEDPQANVYACTYGGLYRYEGERFERVGANAGLDDAYVMNASPAPDGRGLWVATAANLYFWDGDKAVRVLDPSGAPVPFEVGHNVAALADGAVALSHSRALRATRDAGGAWRTRALFDRAAEQAHPELAELGAVYRDGQALWFGCGQTICRRADDGRVRVYGTGDGVPRDAWTAFLRDRHGTLWARSPRHILVLTPGATRFDERPVPPPSMLATTTRHLDLTEDSQGRVLTRSDGGTLRWDGRWQRFDAHNGLPDVPPNALLASRNGELWMSYGGLGVLRWRGYAGVENWGPANGLAGMPNWSLARDAQGAMLFGNERDLHRLPAGGGRIETLHNPLGEPVRDVFALTLGPDKAVWVALYRGQLLRLQGDELKVAATLPAKLRRIFFDDRHRLWLCTTEGVYLIDDLAQPVARRFEALPAVSFGDVEQDAQGRLWFAGKAGVMRLERDDRVTPIRVRGDMPNQLFDKLSIGRDGTLWLSVDDAGLFRGPIGQGDTLTIKEVEDPLLRDAIPYFIRHDRAGRLWVGGSMGLDVLQDGKWTRLHEANGLISEDISEGAFFEDADGSVWIGTSRGVSHLLHPDQLLARAPVTLRIARVERGGQRIESGAVLPWEQLPVRITLSTPGSLAGTDMLKFRYRLRDRQDAWIETNSRTLDFPLLGSGSQVIEVQALDVGRRAQSDVVTFSFEVRPPWWRSPLMLLLWGVAAVALVGSLWRWRVHAIVKHKQQLERLVAARTAELEADKRALELARTALQVQATHDGLTGLHNRTSIMEQLERETLRARAADLPLAVALLDLDHFKQVNDTHGHQVGDVVLSGVADRLANNMRGSDTIGRYGGEELLGLMPGLQPPASERLQALHDAVGARPLIIDGLSLHVTCSIGVAWLQPGETPNELLRRADRALYQAKREGRNRVVVASGEGATSSGPASGSAPALA